MMLTDTSGNSQTQYTYGPFGNTLTSGASNDNPYKFGGREADPVQPGMYYLRARFPDSGLSRFVSRDSAGFQGGGHLYNYAGNAPTMFGDPTGQFAPFSGLPGMSTLAAVAAGFGNDGAGGSAYGAGGAGALGTIYQADAFAAAAEAGPVAYSGVSASAVLGVGPQASGGYYSTPDGVGLYGSFGYAMGWNFGASLESGVFDSLGDFQGPNQTFTFSPIGGLEITTYTDMNGALVGVGAGLCPPGFVLSSGLSITAVTPQAPYPF